MTFFLKSLFFFLERWYYDYSNRLGDMMKNIFKVMFLCFLLLYSGNVFADTCSQEDVTRLRTLASYIEVNYEYIKEEEIYSIDITGLTEELFIEDVTNSKIYKVNDLVDGSIVFSTEIGNLSLKVYTSSCYFNTLRTINLKLPKYNIYSEYEICRELEKFQIDMCDPWYDGEASLDILLEKKYELMEEEEKFNIQDTLLFILEEYLVFVIIGGLVLIGLLVWLIIRRRNRSVLE